MARGMADLSTKDNLWCNYCKQKGNMNETRWNFHGRPPQVHMVAQLYLSQGGAADEQRR